MSEIELAESTPATQYINISCSELEIAGRPRFVFPQLLSKCVNTIVDSDSSNLQAMSSNSIITTKTVSSQIINIQLLMETCRRNRPAISLDSHVLGGIPHIEGTRLSVGQVVGRVRALGSVQAVVEYYRGSVTESQIKEALAYVQEFIERACDPYQASD